MIWSKVAYDYTSKQTKKKDGTITYAVTGCYVMTSDEAKECVKDR